ncbi:uncharacterized protein LOC141717422 isoform X2 [Apium graveolens]|uniref:uncharacterized protein LOC141717422 isoform X2 n=1 Tax=Apium graveolens TaxID=4045 RepID=UPI003D7AB421
MYVSLCEKPHCRTIEQKEGNLLDMNSLSRKKAKMNFKEESGNCGDVKTYIKEREQVLLVLIEHHTKDVERNKRRLSYFTAELEQSQRKLEETKNQLSRLRGQNNFLASKENSDVVKVKIKVEEGSTSTCQYIPQSPENRSKPILVPLQDSVKSSEKSQVDVKGVSSGILLQSSERSSLNKAKRRPEVVIPALNSEIAQPSKFHVGNKASNGSDSTPAHANRTAKVSDVPSKISSGKELVDIQSKGTKRKTVQKEHEDLISLIAGSSSVRKLQCQTNGILPSQHKRKLRSLALCPTDDKLFVTSALDGVVNLWQLQAKGRWPEDIAWHPQGKSIFSVFSADGGDSQVAVLDLNKGKEKRCVTFLEDKPHIKGIINNIAFMPWEDTCFVTAGTDHAVVLWTEKDGIKNWKFQTLHGNLHSSAVMGVAGLQHKKVVLSAGLDKRITGFDVEAGRADYKHQIESKCMSIVPNPCDFNLYVIQTGIIGEQLRLYDYRVRQTELHAFGWEQETSESRSALISQAWSPDGLYITSGSVDPMIHIFDIRYNAKKPTQSIRSHQKRVFKAVWHSTFPLLISISSDLNIGLHKIT